MFAFALMGGAMIVVTARLPEGPVAPVPAPAAEPRARSLFRDPRLTPFLIYGFLMATCQTAQGQTLGFLIIDKLHLTPLQAQGYTAVAMMAGAVAGLLAQWGLIRTFRMSPRSLLRWGAAIAALANVIVALASSYQAVVIGYALSSLGYGFCRPGFTAGASLNVDQSEQARAAGAIAVVNGVNVIVAPLFLMVYGFSHPTPFLANAAVLAALFWYAFRNPTLAHAGEAPTSFEEAAASSLERNREGVSV
jgi:fucose permease